MISDGILPGNEGREYVLRRLLRRAVFHGRLLGIEGAFLTKFIDEVNAQMGEAYPELLKNVALVKGIVASEEERFSTTLNNGRVYLDEQLGAQLRQQPLRTRPRRARLLDRLPARDVPAHHLGPDHPDALLLHAVNEELTEVRRAFPEVGANDVFGKVERNELKRSTELGEL